MIISFNNFFKRKVKIYVHDIEVSEFSIMDEYVKNTYGKTVYSDYRKTVDQKVPGRGDIPISEWDIISVHGIERAYWRFTYDADAAHFILTMGEMLVKYNYRVEGGQSNVN